MAHPGMQQRTLAWMWAWTWTHPQVIQQQCHSSLATTNIPGVGNQPTTTLTHSVNTASNQDTPSTSVAQRPPAASGKHSEPKGQHAANTTITLPKRSDTSARATSARHNAIRTFAPHPTTQTMRRQHCCALVLTTALHAPSASSLHSPSASQPHVTCLTPSFQAALH